MRLINSILLYGSLCLALPHADILPPPLAKKFVSIETEYEQGLRQGLGVTQSKTWRKNLKLFSNVSIHSPPIIPSFPTTVTNPVDPNSWLMQYARSSKVMPYWKFTETLWAPCQRHRQPIPNPASCAPACEDIHSLTELRLFSNCVRSPYEASATFFAPICTFATFVLPDSQCPGRVNSYKLRCPRSLAELKRFSYRSSWQMSFMELTRDIEAGNHTTPGECKPVQSTVGGTSTQPPAQTPTTSWYISTVSPTPAPQTQVTSYIRRGSDDASQGHRLSKRTYSYRTYLSSKKLYRFYDIERPPKHVPDWIPERPTNWIPWPYHGLWDCYVEEELVQTERVVLNNTLIDLCFYAEGAREFPDERCPGKRTPETACPSNDEELIEAIKGEYAHPRDHLGPPKHVTTEEVKRLLELEEKRVEPPVGCAQDESSRCCIGPDSNHDVNICNPQDDRWLFGDRDSD